MKAWQTKPDFQPPYSGGTKRKTMSYEIVKKIRIENGQVLITSDSNNVFPKYYRERVSEYCTDILQNEGAEALDICLLKAYEEGNFQPGIENKWSRAISRLRLTEEYKAYNWRNSDYPENCPIQAARKSPQFDALLLSALNLKPSKEKYIVRKTAGMQGYVLRVTKRFIKYTGSQCEAKIFRSFAEAENIGKLMPGYEVISL